MQPPRERDTAITCFFLFVDYRFQVFNLFLIWWD